jgi:hypothetical protein
MLPNFGPAYAAKERKATRTTWAEGSLSSMPNSSSKPAVRDLKRHSQVVELGDEAPQLRWFLASYLRTRGVVPNRLLIKPTRMPAEEGRITLAGDH